MEEAQKVDLITLLRTFKKEGLDNFIVIRKEKFENNFIPKTKVKEKIEELNEILEEKYSAEKISVFSGNTYMEKFKLIGKLQVLQDLLGKE